MNKIPYLMYSKHLSLIVKGKTYNINKTDTKYDTYLQLAKDNKEEELHNALNVVTKIFNQFGLVIEKGVVSYNGELLPSALNRMIISMYDQDVSSVQPLINFWNKLKLNPSYRPLNFLSDFIEANNIVINQEGNLILYKIVKRTEEPKIFVDLYTKTFKHEFGVPVLINRNKVDDNSNNLCSHGLHVCCWNYLPHYGSVVDGKDAIILVELDPKDIVAIPADYNNSKLRVCKYIPIEEYMFSHGELKNVLFEITKSNTLLSDEILEESDDEDKYDDDDEY